MNKIILTVLVIIIFIALGALSYWYFYIPKSTIQLVESKSSVAGDYRGFYVQINSNELSRLEVLEAEGVKNILIAFDIEDYLNAPIDEVLIQELDNVLVEAKKRNMKIIFRAAYGFHPNYEDPENIEQIIDHIEQIAPTINKNKSVIMCVQAGFLGPWGEWHSSDFMDGTEDEVENRNRIIKGLLTSLDQDISIHLRRPRFIRDAMAEGLGQYRLGLHNDALLASHDDLGTYDDPDYTRKDELAWIKDELDYSQNGGEMPMVSEYSEINHAVSEFKSLHITYLNKMYNVEVLNDWASKNYEGQNGLTYMENHLGYRLYLDEMELSTYIKPNRALNLSIGINNSGFSSIDEGSGLYLLVKQGSTRIVHVQLIEDLSILVNDKRITENINVVLKDMINENYKSDIQLGLYISTIDTTYYEFGVPENQLGSIQLANDEITYINGINYFALYQLIDGIYVLRE